MSLAFVAQPAAKGSRTSPVRLVLGGATPGGLYWPSMRTSNDVQQLAAAIAALVNTINEIIKEQVQRAVPEAPAKTTKSPTPFTPFDSSPYDPFLTKRQLAAHLQVSERTIYYWYSKGYLPAFKVGRLVRFRLSDVQKAWNRRFKKFPGAYDW